MPRVLLWFAVAAGLVLRAWVYARNPSLWIDEAMLALNVLPRGPAELLEPLDWNQGAPVGFLLASKLVVSLFGGGEYALRLLPFAASVLSVPAFAAFAYRSLSLSAARLAVGLFALSPYLAGYAGEFKQYELDAAICAGLLALGRGRAVALAAAGAAAVWFSHPAVFVLGGIGTGMLVARRDRAAVLVIAAWLASFAACYFLVLRRLGTNAYLLDYWAGAFLPLPPTSPGEATWLVRHFAEAFAKPGGFGDELGLAGAAVLCFLVGCLDLARSDRPLLAAVVGPLLLCLFASALKQYPFSGRLLLFAVPLLVVGVARGLAVLADLLRGWHPAAGGVAVGVVFLGPVAECYELAKWPLHAEPVREALTAVRDGWQDGDVLFASDGAGPALRYYGPPGKVVYAGDVRGDMTRIGRELKAVRGERVWVLVAHARPGEVATVRAYLDAMGGAYEVMCRGDAVLWRGGPVTVPSPPHDAKNSIP